MREAGMKIQWDKDNFPEENVERSLKSLVLDEDVYKLRRGIGFAWRSFYVTHIDLFQFEKRDERLMCR